MYTHVVVGGTFDGLHSGHIHLLDKAFKEGVHITIGLTSEAYIRRFKKDTGVAPFSLRYQALTKWLRANGLANRTTIVPLDNRWGPALLGDFDAIIVTADNKATAEEINTLRGERGLPELSLVEVSLIAARDRHPISSTRVRSGEIDKKGRLLMPDSLRPELQKAFGRIIKNEDIVREVPHNRDNIVISVGDVTTQAIFLTGVKPALVIIDLYVERRPYQSFDAFKFPKQYEIVHVASGPGYISRDAIEVIKGWSKTVRRRRRVVMVVDGEEDLLTIPAIIHAPVGSFVYYGQPPKGDKEFGTYKEGLVEVKVTKEKKKEAIELLSKFI